MNYHTYLKLGGKRKVSINTERTVKENLRNIFWEAVAFTRFLSDVSLGNYYTRMSCFCKYSKRGSGWCQTFSIFYLNDIILKTKKTCYLPNLF